MNTQLHDQKLIKKTHYKYVKFGKFSELYIYEKPIFYNQSPIFNQSAISRGNSLSRRNDNLYVARSKINRLVLANCDWSICAPRFVTFTFAKNITSLKEANQCWANFIRKFRKDYPNIKYLGVIEFQKRGAVHYHVLFFNLKYKPFIKDDIKKIWTHGFIKFKSAKRIEKIQHLGLYLAKYLQKDILDVRLLGEKAFFTSKNLTQPEFLREHKMCSLLERDMIEKGAIIETYQSTYYGTIKKLKLCTR